MRTCAVPYLKKERVLIQFVITLYASLVNALHSQLHTGMQRAPGMFSQNKLTQSTTNAFQILYVELKHKGGRLSCGDRFYVGAQSVAMNSSLDATDLQQPGLESLTTIVTIFELFLVIYGVSEKLASEILRTEITQHISS